MIIVSWDVGVKNLAYCVLKYDDNQVVQILDWDVINLIEDDIIELECCGMLKAKKNMLSKKCDKKATYYMLIPGSTKMNGFCKTHLSQSSNYWSEKKTIKLFKESKTCNQCQYKNRTNALCGRSSKYYYQDEMDKIYYCYAHYKSELGKKIKTFSPILIKNTIVQKYPTAALQLTLIKKLDDLSEHFAKLGVNQIIIENQPSYRNPKMKSISNTLFDYFMIRGYIDKFNGLDIQLVRFMCPSNKLKVNNDNTLEVFRGKTDKKQKYKLTKTLSIQYTKKLLINEPEHLEYLDMFSQKQDDICDAYLQGRYYLEFILNKKKQIDPKIDKAICI